MKHGGSDIFHVCIIFGGTGMLFFFLPLPKTFNLLEWFIGIVFVADISISRNEPIHHTHTHTFHDINTTTTPNRQHQIQSKTTDKTENRKTFETFETGAMLYQNIQKLYYPNVLKIGYISS